MSKILVVTCAYTGSSNPSTELPPRLLALADAPDAAMALKGEVSPLVLSPEAAG
ncbi:MAG TPA: hypothetical protein VIN03_24050 [Roseateles sp.]